VLIDMTANGQEVTTSLNQGFYDAISRALPPQSRSSVTDALNDLITALDDRTLALERATSTEE
jgi:hypothetical protein